MNGAREGRLAPRLMSFSAALMLLVSLRAAAETRQETADAKPAAVACPCAEIYAAARAQYDGQPGPTFCQSARILPPSSGDDLILEAAKEKLAGAKWRRITLQLWAFEHCNFGIRCSKCAAFIYAEKKIPLVLHKPLRETKSRLSEVEMAACKELIRTLEECGRPYPRSQPSG